MKPLASVYLFKIVATLLCWAVPLLVFPHSLLQALGMPEQGSTLFLRLLGWAYLALCTGYGFGLLAAMRGVVLTPPVVVGIVSNGGACLILLIYGVTGSFASWHAWVQWLAWISVLATALITAGLYRFGWQGRVGVAT